MLTRLLRAGFLSALAGQFGLQPAHADIYTWVDTSGTVNVSNLAPPDGVSVTSVIHQSPPKSTERSTDARAAAREAEMQALTERIRNLELEVELATRQTPAPVEYRPVPVPVAVPYGVNLAPPPMQYAANVAPPSSLWCDVTQMDCGLAWGSALYPPTVVILRVPNVRRFHPGHPEHHFAAQPPRVSDRPHRR